MAFWSAVTYFFSDCLVLHNRGNSFIWIQLIELLVGGLFRVWLVLVSEMGGSTGLLYVDITERRRQKGNIRERATNFIVCKFDCIFSFW